MTTSEPVQELVEALRKAYNELQSEHGTLQVKKCTCSLCSEIERVLARYQK